MHLRGDTNTPSFSLYVDHAPHSPARASAAPTQPDHLEARGPAVRVRFHRVHDS